MTTRKTTVNQNIETKRDRIIRSDLTEVHLIPMPSDVGTIHASGICKIHHLPFGREEEIVNVKFSFVNAEESVKMYLTHDDTKICMRLHSFTNNKNRLCLYCEEESISETLED